MLDSRWMLVVGALIGALAAATGLLKSTNTIAPADTVAVVDGTQISKEAYLATLDSYTREKQTPLTAIDREQILQRLIDEQLLIQRAMSIGLLKSDPAIRAAISTAMIESVTREAAATVPDNRDLEQFLAANANYFASPELVRIRRMIFRGSDPELTRQRAYQAFSALAEQPFAIVAQNWADGDILRIPDALLPAKRLAGLIGPTQAEVARSLETGEYSQPLVGGDGFAIIQLVDKRPGSVPELAAIHQQVLSEFTRRAEDKAWRDYVVGLREQAEINMNHAFISELNELDK